MWRRIVIDGRDEEKVGNDGSDGDVGKEGRGLKEKLKVIML
jgi:hypothetical protein